MIVGEHREVWFRWKSQQNNHLKVIRACKAKLEEMCQRHRDVF